MTSNREAEESRDDVFAGFGVGVSGLLSFGGSSVAEVPRCVCGRLKVHRDGNLAAMVSQRQRRDPDDGRVFPSNAQHEGKEVLSSWQGRAEKSAFRSGRSRRILRSLLSSGGGLFTNAKEVLNLLGEEGSYFPASGRLEVSSFGGAVAPSDRKVLIAV